MNHPPIECCNECHYVRPDGVTTGLRCHLTPPPHVTVKPVDYCGSFRKINWNPVNCMPAGEGTWIMIDVGLSGYKELPYKIGLFQQHNVRRWRYL